MGIQYAWLSLSNKRFWYAYYLHLKFNWAYNNLNYVYTLFSIYNYKYVHVIITYTYLHT